MNAEDLAILFVAILFPIFWMVVAWRAMRAHERIADVLARREQREAS